MRRIPRAAFGAALTGAVTAALTASAVGAQVSEPEPDRLDVSGLVADAATGAALPGAAITIRGTPLRTLTNEDGRFVLRGVPRGEQTWVIERLGYATWEQALEVQHLDQLKIGLLARPIALEAIRVKVNRLEERRKLAPYSVQTVRQEELRSAAASDAIALVRSRMHWLPMPCPAGSGSGSAPVPGLSTPNESSLRDPASLQGMNLELCIRYRGAVARPGVCIDDRPIPLEYLAAYGADEIYAIDYIGGPAPQIRLYTEHFLESGRRLRPLTFGCR